MKIRAQYILITVLMITVFGCGIFKSTTKTETTTDSTSVSNETTSLAEYELLKADIPASYIKTITTPSGMEIELRDSIKAGRNSKDVDNTRPKKEDSSKSVVEQPNPGSISIAFERNKKQRDSSVTKAQKEQQESELQETEVETSAAWITWILVGVAIALALALAGMIFLN